MAQEKWKQRDRKLHKKKEGMRVSGRSIFTLQELQRRKAEELRIAKREKQAKDE
jgi:phosphotransferase system HPr-like phosphotransfer protein